MTDPSLAPQQANHRDAKAQAKAAKAYAKAQRPWFKKKRFVFPIALVALIVIISALSGGDDGAEKVAASTSGDKTSADSKKVSKDKPIKVGETVKLKGTQYTVDKVSLEDSVGGEFLKEEAKGQYVVVEITIENKKDETKVFSDSAAKFTTTDGKSYSTDSDASIAVAGDGGTPLLFEEMQPDLPTNGTLVYDVPKNKVKGGLLEVSDLFGGGEAYIDLGL